MSVLEGRIIQYVKMLNQKDHCLCLLMQNSTVNIVTIFIFKVFVFRKYQA